MSTSPVPQPGADAEGGGMPDSEFEAIIDHNFTAKDGALRVLDCVREDIEAGRTSEVMVLAINDEDEILVKHNMDLDLWSTIGMLSQAIHILSHQGVEEE